MTPWNRSLLVLAIVVIPAVLPAKAQRALPDDNLAYPVLIAFKGSTGSGFFLNVNGAVFLITAKHVLFDPNTQKLRENQTELLSYSKDPSDQKNNLIALDFEALQAENLGIVGVSIENVKTFDQVLIGNDVLVFGYPTSLGLQAQPQLDLHRPLLRKGIVAGQNLQRKSIVLDCPVYQGNSDGPVIQVESKNLLEKHFSVIEVIGEFVPFVDQGQRSTFITLNNSGYSIATPMDFVMELAK
jgi:S1-C subfamily serine protease